MKAQVSFGSQPQNRPQALSAQMAPAMTAKVQTGKPKTAVRWATRSSAAAEGSRSTIRKPPAAGATRAAATPPPAGTAALTADVAPLVTSDDLASDRDRSRYSTLAMPLTKKM